MKNFMVLYSYSIVGFNDSAFNREMNKLFQVLLASRILRKLAILLAERRVYSVLLRDKKFPRNVQKEKFYAGRSMIHAMEKTYERASSAPRVREALVNSFIQNFFLKGKKHRKKFKETFGRMPPNLLAISPGKFCNLKCSGCYASSSAAASEKIEWDTLDRIITG